MNRKQIILLIFIVLIIAALIIPFTFQTNSESVDQTINLSATLTGAIGSLLTFILAFLLYNKFGIDGMLVKNRAEVVFSLLEKINDSVFFVEHLAGASFAVGLGNSEKKNLERFYSTKLSFSEAYLDELENLFKIANSPFMPKEIVMKMEKLRYPVLSIDIPEETKNEYAKIYKLKHKKEQDLFGRLNQEESTLFDFLVYYYNIKDSIVTWLVKNTSIDIKDLNI